ncbi:U4/U6 small nuclear ribonucleoprotein Prp31-like [Daphnia pulicaria]|uniref:U4/U6 small nuclear ribonucleoprotein Prp31-like n=1 Tax=Daphnia pulicaria TaxID=35523 RepID=UPI001EEA4FD3|nr:U4/U6 small nuclear ribonucleoprotein Prp31-like [Daphnia pulicaria]
MSLADELLADLEMDDGDDDHIMDQLPEPMNEIKTEIKQEFFVAPVAKLTLDDVCKLRNSPQLVSILEQIEKYCEQNRTSDNIQGPVEADPEYQLIVEANNLAVEIDNDIIAIHKFVRDLYAKRFSELESLVVNPLEYITTVKELGNEISQAKHSSVLQQHLTQATIMVLSVTASTTQGKPLDSTEMDRVMEACDTALELEKCKSRIYSYVESRMTFIAPNLSVLVGAPIAAKLMGVAGGLTALSKMPSCNIQLLGNQKRTLSGFSQTATLPHTGFIFESPIVQDTPPDLRRKAARLVSSKCTLAARVDAFHESADGSVGRNFREDVERKLDRLQEPPPVKAIRPLPAPLEAPRKKRGGKRVRRMKEKYAQTEMRKQANRMTFGEIEEDAYQEDLGYTRGMMGKGGPGRIRGPTIDEKTKVRISKALQRNLQRQQAYGGATTVKRQVAGTASSVAFTPLQGLEIVNPQAAEKKVSEANIRYFSNQGTFFNVKDVSSTPLPGASSMKKE